MGQDGFLLQSDHLFEINTTPREETETWVRLARGFSSFEVGLNENVDETAYLDGGSFKSSTVMGGQLTLNFEGHRYRGDEAQDFIFSKQVGFGNERVTNFRWTQPAKAGEQTGAVYEGEVTLTEISGSSGDADGKENITVVVAFNGEPEYTPPVPETP